VFRTNLKIIVSEIKSTHTRSKGCYELNKEHITNTYCVNIDEPVPVAQTFSFVDEENGIDLSRFSYIDTMVTVVDAFNFFKDFGSPETLMDKELTDMEGDHRTLHPVGHIQVHQNQEKAAALMTVIGVQDA